MNTTAFKKAIFLLLTGHLFLGWSHIAFLPLWEGYDETAHYAYIQQLADRHEIPRQGRARLSADTSTYARVAPLPDLQTKAAPNPAGFTYRSFFQSTADQKERARRLIHDPPDQPRVFREGGGPNWQAQHPPLYYLLMTPLLDQTRQISWIEQVMILRMGSYLLAWAALVIGIMSLAPSAAQPGGQTLSSYQMMLGMAVWPLLFPSWFPTMARIGNDSLCALIMALVWALALRAWARGASCRNSFALGLVLGLGCLTKAYFVPVAAGIIVLWGPLLLRSQKKSIQESLARLLWVMVPMMAVCGWWYFANQTEHGVLLGSDEMIRLKNQGGLVQGLRDNFSIRAWFRGNLAFMATVNWCSSWSWARPPYVFLGPMVLLSALLSAAYLAAIRRSPRHSPECLPLWCGLPVLAGFGVHILVRIALTGTGSGTGGYYLNFLAVPFGAALGIGLSHRWSEKAVRFTWISLGVYALALAVATSWAQILLFAGIMTTSSAQNFYQLPNPLPPFFGLPLALERLKTIVWPAMGAAAWILGSLSVVAGLFYGASALRRWSAGDAVRP